ncbi:MAG: universal stress protein [Segetibacter sp.]|jgi:nucleotide-binding universal stress UspA family protein|nr:universal stress protein [Segetibacter sp.]
MQLMLFLCFICLIQPAYMNTILVPTDFSATAKNAALYAIQLATQLHATKVILYNAYQAFPPIITEPTAPVIPVMDVDTLKGISKNSMMQFKQSLQAFCPQEILLEEKIEYAIIADDINKICRENKADLIVLGITATSKIEEVLIGSTAISIVKQTKVPVIIVPQGATYSIIKSIMLACDYKRIAETTPVSAIQSILDATEARLHIVNVYEGNREMNADIASQKELLLSFFKEYNPQFYFENNHSFITAINQFVDTHSIDLIITIPKKHGFFEGLFKEKHAKQLAFHSHVPLMFIHQEDL